MAGLLQHVFARTSIFVQANKASKVGKSNGKGKQKMKRSAGDGSAGGSDEDIMSVGLVNPTSDGPKGKRKGKKKQKLVGKGANQG